MQQASAEVQPLQVELLLGQVPCQLALPLLGPWQVKMAVGMLMLLRDAQLACWVALLLVGAVQYVQQPWVAVAAASPLLLLLLLLPMIEVELLAVQGKPKLPRQRPACLLSRWQEAEAWQRLLKLWLQQQLQVLQQAG